MSDFDPYQQWLGIPPQEQPPDHYRLLGLRRFEPDLRVIQTATDNRMAVVRVYQTGPRASWTQKLLNELAAAKLCLLNPYSKAEYDASLATPGAAQLTEAMLPASLPSAVEVPISLARPSPLASPGLRIESRSTIRRTKEGRWWPLLGVLTIVIAGLIAWTALTRNGILPANLRVFQSVQSGGENTTVVSASSGSDSPAKPDRPDTSGLIVQEASGSVVFRMSAAALHGQISLGTPDDSELLVGWVGPADRAAWRFRIERLPSQGIFRVRLGYQAASSAADAEYVLAVDGKEHWQEVRTSDRMLEDEFYLAVPSSGEHTLAFSVRNLPATAEFGLQQLEFSVPRR